jgi:hypothetical protein
LHIVSDEILIFFQIQESKAHQSEDIEDQVIPMQEWKGGGGRNSSLIITQSPKSANQAPQMANIGKVKFQPPNVPVVSFKNHQFLK